MTQPDHEDHMAEVHRLAEEARRNPPEPKPAESGGASVLTDRPVVLAPIHLGANAHDVIPERYVIHYSITKCANCGTESRDNEFYALRYLKSRVNGSRVRNLVRCDKPLYNLPVDRIPTSNHRVPFCCECPAIDLSHLPPPPEESKLHDLPEPTLKGQRPRSEPKETKAKTPRGPATLDDLI